MLIFLQGSATGAKAISADPGSYAVTGTATTNTKHGWRITAGVTKEIR